MLLVDGHNVIGRALKLSLDREEEGREELLRRIGAARGSGGEVVVVVFDGKGPSATEKRLGAVRVVFAPASRSADEEILRRLSSGNARAGTVVTSDRELGRRARQLGACVEASEAFWQRIRAGRRVRDLKAETAKPEPTAEDVDDFLELFRKGRRIEKHNM